MNIATVMKRIVDGLWAVGGIGAAAELGYEDLGAHPDRPLALAPCALAYSGVRGSRRPSGEQARRASALPTLEGRLCCNPVARKSVR